MSANKNDGPTKPTGELYDCSNVFIADASVLPTSLGINPMITIEAISRMISRNVIKRLNETIEIK
jgi:choline dehydrogenase-like flavoprotein